VIVVDTNILAYLFLEGEHTLEAERALKIDPDWVSSRLWRSEFRSVLTLYLKRRLFSLDASYKIMREAELFMREKEYEPSSLEVLRLASVSGCSAYDCEFVALSLALDVPLVTCDRFVLKHFSHAAVSLKAFVSA